MPTINIHGVSQETYDELCRLAEADGQSVNAEALAIFEEGVQQRQVRRSRKEALRLADESRRQLGWVAIDSLELLREGRSER